MRNNINVEFGKKRPVCLISTVSGVDACGALRLHGSQAVMPPSPHVPAWQGFSGFGVLGF